MKLLRSAIFGIIFLTLFAEVRAAAIRILPLGDSITQGLTGHNSYRRALWRMLTQAGYDVDFIGGRDFVYPSGPPALPDFDLNHEGYAGGRADELPAFFASFLTGSTPDIVLLHVGSNDAIQNHGGASYLPNTRSDIEAIITALRTDNPNVKILLAKIIPLDPGTETIVEVTDADTVARINSLNTEIADIASDLTTVASPIVVVDQNTGFNPVVDNGVNGGDTFDGVHPDDSGEAKMAAKWFQGLQGVLPPAPLSFFRAINVGGPALTVDGNSWEADEDDIPSPAANFTASGSRFTYPDPGFPDFNPDTITPFTPPVDTKQKDMLRSFRFGSDQNITLTHVPVGTYKVYLSTFEDSVPLKAELRVQGVLKETYTSGSVGRWDRLGPYDVEVTVADGTIAVQLTDVTDPGDDLPFISGLEVWEVPPAPPVPTFYRGVNVGGSAVTIGGNNWEGDNAPNFTVDGSVYTSPFTAFDPAVADPQEVTMLQTLRHSADLNLSLTSLPNGIYNVYVWTFEETTPLTATLFVEGGQVAVYNSVQGRSDRLGPFPVVVNDGNIQVRLQCNTPGDHSFISGLEVWQVPAAPEIRVSVAGNDIADGQGAAIGFGSVLQGATGPTVTFTVFNDGGQTLTLGAVNVPAGFIVTELLALSLAPGNNDTFTVQLNTTTLGIQGGTLSFSNNDSNENPFNFTINGEVTLSSPEGVFYRAVNVGGPALVVDGNNWEADPNANFTADGTPFSYPDAGFPLFNPDTITPFTPPVDTAHKDMLRDFRLGQDQQVSLTGVPDGTYDVYVWTFEDSGALTANLSVEGNVVLNPFTSGPNSGDWDRLGPFRVTVSDGNIQVQLTTVGASAADSGFISGLEVWEIPPAPAQTFYRAINVGGNALTIDGNNWEGDNAPNFTKNGTVANKAGFVFNPPVDADHATMLRAIRYDADMQLALTSVPNGNYNVYVWTFEDSVSLNATLSVEGIVVGDYTSGPAGKSDRLGPFPITVVDGNIQVRFLCNSPGDADIISGLEVWQVPAAPATPEIRVSVGGNDIADGQGAAIGFGSVLQGATGPTVTFTVFNDGGQTLTLGAVNVPAGFIVTELLALSLAPGNNDTFTVQLNTTTLGIQGGTLSFSNNDSNENPFNFTINGEVTLSSPEGVFYRAVNVGGPALVVDGNNWEADPNANFTADGTPFSYPDAGFPLFNPDTITPFTPPVDTAHKDMLRDFRLGQDQQVSLTGVPDGTYDVYVWTFEDSGALTANLSVEGNVVLNPFTSGPNSGDWDRLGPFRVTVSDGNIQVQLTTVGASAADSAFISGLEVWEIPPPPAATFYRAIDVGGSAITIDGNNWEGDSAPNFTKNGTLATKAGFVFNPPVSADHATMLRTIRYDADMQLALTSVPNGIYDVYVWTFEDSVSLNATLSVEGNVVANYTSGPAGKSDRLGPYQVTVTDGNIQVRFLCNSPGDADIISGLEVWQVATLPPPAEVFYRAIDVGGSAITIDGNNWEGDSAPNFTKNGTLETEVGFVFNPPVSADQATMLRTIRYSSNMQLALTSVPNGNYNVYVWTFEDSVPLNATLSVEGIVVGDYTSGPAGKSDRLGPFPITVTDGNIQVGFLCNTPGDADIISGLEVWLVP